MDTASVKLVDIGNTHAKIYHDGKIEYVKASEFSLDQKFYYICVNKHVSERLKNIPFAVDLQKYIDIKTTYQGMGVDRKVVCSYIDDGVIVDAGSAITIDVMKDKEHQGGYIFPGISALFDSYKQISDVLKVEQLQDITLDKLPKNTQEAINFAVFKSVVLLVKDVSKDKKIYFCGGDGKILSSFFENSVFEEDLIFKAMKKIIKDL